MQMRTLCAHLAAAELSTSQRDGVGGTLCVGKRNMCEAARLARLVVVRCGRKWKMCFIFTQ